MVVQNNQHENINPIIVAMKDTGVLNTKKVSDKYHTFGDLYDHRNYLFSVICSQNKDKSWKSKKHFDEENDPMFNGDFVVGINTPLGVVSYHCKLEFWDLFDDVKEIPNAPEYDGCTQDETFARLRSLASESKHESEF